MPTRPKNNVNPLRRPAQTMIDSEVEPAHKKSGQMVESVYHSIVLYSSTSSAKSLCSTRHVHPVPLNRLVARGLLRLHKDQELGLARKTKDMILRQRIPHGFGTN